MDTFRSYRLAYGQPIFFREDEDEDSKEKEQESGGLSQKDIDNIVSAITSKTKRSDKRIDALEAKIDKILEARGSKKEAKEKLDQEKSETEDLQSKIDELQKALKSGDDEGANNKGLRVQLEQLAKQVEKHNSKTTELQDQIAERDKKLLETNRKSALRAFLTRDNTRAHNPDDVIQLLLPRVVQDDELGDALPWKTEDGGEDLVPLEKFVDLYAEKQPYLFQGDEKKGRGGSGAGGGRSAEAEQALTADAIASMSWGEYEKNRDSILEKAEKSFGRMF